MARRDCAFPFRIDPVSRQGAEAAYADHVVQMIRQILLTTPGERADLPEFGCGLRRMLFAPNADGVAAGGGPAAGPAAGDPVQATARLLVRQALEKWLAGQIEVKDVTVTRAPAAGQVSIDITFLLIETLSLQRTEIRLP